MTKENYEKQKDNLFERWKAARPEYEINGRFTSDGINDFDAWQKAKPKILFLLKENHDTEDNYEPDWGLTVDSKPFTKNIAIWRQVIMELYADPSKQIDFYNINLPEKINDVALVEVKKKNESSVQSDTKDIIKYAENDREFLKEQIELINPDAILCCGTYNSYAVIYNEKTIEQIHYKWIESSNVDASIWTHNNRVIYNFYHPSYFIKSPESLFDLLCLLTKESNGLELLKNKV